MGKKVKKSADFSLLWKSQKTKISIAGSAEKKTSDEIEKIGSKPFSCLWKENKSPCMDAGSLTNLLVTIFTDILNLPTGSIKESTDLRGLNIESILLIEAAERLNTKCGINVDPAKLYEFSTVEKMSDYIAHPDKKTSHSSKCKTAKSSQLSEDIAVVGISARFPQSEDINEFWKNISEPKDLIQEIPKERWDWRNYYSDPKPDEDKTKIKWGGFIKDADKFDADFFHISPREAELMDPQQRIAMEIVWAAMEDAGYNPRQFSGSKIGLFIGIWTSDYGELLTKSAMPVYPHTPTGASFSILTNRISYFLNFHGPSAPVDTACSSSLVAVHNAVNAIKNGECDMALAGGVNLLLSPRWHIAFDKAGMLSPDGRCKTFDNGANGYARGEGAGIILLKPLSKAMEDRDHIYGVIKSTGVNHGGYTNSLTAPNPDAQADLLIETYEKAGVSPDTVSYIETHGTGTKLGDPIEINGIIKAFSELYEKNGKPLPDKKHCGLGAVKTAIGHLESAAGIAGLIKMLLAMKYKTMPGIVHFNELNPQIRLDNTPFYIADKTKKWEPLEDQNGTLVRRAGVSSFGFGGANAHVVLEEYADRHQRPVSGEQEIGHDGPHLFVLSAKNEECLKEYAGKMEKFIARNHEFKNENFRISDIAYTSRVGREAMEHRLALVAANKDELISGLADYCKGKETENLYIGKGNKESANSKILIEGKAGREFLKVAIQEKQLSQLARLWVSGIEIDWNLLYPGGKQRKAPLPTYPFARERYWFDAVDSQPLMTSSGCSENPHPCIDRNVSDFEEQCYIKEFKEEEFWLKHHLVGKDKILPGVVYLEMLRAAGQMASKENHVRKIKNIVWIKPIALFSESGENSLEVKVGLYPNQDDIDFKISSGGEKFSDIVHAQGKLVYENYMETGDHRLDIDKIKKRCHIRKTHDQIYHRFDELQLNLGPSFRVIHEFFTNGSESLSLLKLHPDLKQNFQEFFLHPTLMDGALQTGLQSIEKTIKWLQLPFSIGEVEIFHPFPEICHAYVTMTDKKMGTDITRFNVWLTDQSGRILVKIKDVYLKTVKLFSIPQIKTAYYLSEWEKRELPLEKNPQYGDFGVLLLFDLKENPHQILKDELPFSSVISVKPGGGYNDNGDLSYEINPTDPQDYLLLLATLKKRGLAPDKIVHMWSHGDFIPEEKTLRSHIDEGFNSIFYLAQALIKEKVRTDILYIYPCPRNLIQPQYAAASGFAKSLALENSKIVCKTIGIDNPLRKSKKRFSDMILREFSYEINGAYEIVYAGKKRLAKAVKEFDPEKEAMGKISLKKGGVYLITGGAGGLGLIFAEYLAKEFQASLILTGRSDLSHEKEDRLKAFKKFGANVIYIKTDASKEKEAEKLITRITSEFGELNGIIHSAGVVKDAFILNKTKDSMEQVLAPKVFQTVHLDTAAKDEKLDFFMMFSSSVAITGNAGQSDYAYANCFMDYFAEYREKLRSENMRQGKTISINWPLWKEGGMQVDDQMKRWFADVMGMHPLENDMGIEAFVRGLSWDKNRFMVVRGALKTAALGLPENKNELRLETGAFEGTPETSGENEGNHDFRGRIEKDMLKLATTISKSRKPIDVNRNLTEYGFDSVLLIDAANTINQQYGLDLTPAIFFEYASIREFAGHLNEEYKERLAAYYQKDLKKSFLVPKDRAEKISAPFKRHDIKNRFAVNPTKKTSPPQNMADAKEPIAVIGMDGIFPMADNVQEFWRHLINKTDLITEVPSDHWDYRPWHDPDADASLDKIYCKWGGFIENVDKFDHTFFNISPREAETMDPQLRLLLQVLYATAEDAGYSSRIRKTKTGIYVGVCFHDYMQEMDRRNKSVSPYDGTGNTSSMLANRPSFYFNLTGPSLAVDTACSSSLVALHLACKALQNKECDMAFVGGVNLLLNSWHYRYFCSIKALSRTGRCHTFDKAADGYVPAESIAAVLLKPLSQAERDGDIIHAVIKGSAITHGGYTPSITAPSARGEANVILNAWNDAGIEPETIGYIEAHGTGTELGDPVEINALKKAFKQYTDKKHFCAIGSAKAHMGHAEGAAGIVGVIKSILSIKHKTIPAMPKFSELNPYIQIENSPLYINREPEEWNTDNVGIRRAGISSFGFGGAYAHIVLEEYKE